MGRDPVVHAGTDHPVGSVLEERVSQHPGLLCSGPCGAGDRQEVFTHSQRCIQQWIKHLQHVALSSIIATAGRAITCVIGFPVTVAEMLAGTPSSHGSSLS